MPRLSPPLAVLGLAGLLVAGCAGLPPSGGGASEPPSRTGSAAPKEYTIAKLIRYSFTLQNKTGRLIPRAQFWTYAPVPQTAHQWVEKVSATQAFRTSRDEVGNEILHFEFENIPPYGARIVSITAHLKMSEAAVATGERDLQRFLVPEPYIESDDTAVAVLARSFQDSTVTEGMKRAHDWVSGNLFSETYVAEDRGARYALTARKGDCTEYAYLLTALGRASQVPSRPVGGYVFAGSNIVKASDYHNWMEFRADGSWRLADAQKDVFMHKEIDYVAMRIISVTGETPIASQRFSYAGEGLEVIMN